MSSDPVAAERLPAPSSSERDSVASRDDERDGEQERESGLLRPVGESWEDLAIRIAMDEHLDWFTDE